MNAEEQQTRLAEAIGEWATVSEQLHWMEYVGIDVPYSIRGRSEDELNALCRTWWQNNHGPTYVIAEHQSTAITEARAWTAEH